MIATEQKHGSLIATLPGELQKKITDWALENIPDFHLAPKGIEFSSHITILYGFEEDSEEVLQRLKSLLIRYGPIIIEIGELSVFADSGDGVVLKLDVISPQLHELNSILRNEFAVESIHSEYIPHITIAYLLPEVADSYLELKSPIPSQRLQLDDLEWISADEENRIVIPLSFLSSHLGIGKRYNKDVGGTCEQGERSDLTGCIPAHKEPSHERFNRKALSAFSETSGAALIKPPKQPKSLFFDPEGIKKIRKKYRQLRRAKAIFAPSAPGMKKGTKVRLNYRAPFRVGQIGTVRRYEPSHHVVTIHFADGEEYGFLPDELDVIEQKSLYLSRIKHSPFNGYYIKDVGAGTCEQGERADLTGCTPASRVPTKEKPKQREVQAPSIPTKTRAVKEKMVSAKREGKGKEAKVILSNGQLAPDHIKPAMVPPAWKKVKINPNPDGDILVTGVDSKGRGQKLYSEKFEATNQKAKFGKISEGLTKIKEIHGENQKNRKSEDTRISEVAYCTWLMLEQATRPGSEADTKGFAELYGEKMSKDNFEIKYNKKGKASVVLKVKDKKIPVRDDGTKREIIKRIESGGSLEDSDYWLKSFGATTLEGRHVVEADDGTRLQFVGKEGVYHDHLIRDKGLGDMLLERRKTSNERGGKLFSTDYYSVIKYSKSLDGGLFTPKDFRTAKATSLAIDAISEKGDCCDSPEEYKAAVAEVAERVSNVLGNRPQQALETYISPGVWSAWRNPE